MTQKQLQTEFNQLNDRFFQGKLNGVQVRFGKTEGIRGADGSFNTMTKIIRVSPIFQNLPVMCCIVLIHEMAHAYLDLMGYVGYPADAGHGGLFQVELDRLYKAGAYDSLL